MYCLQVGDWGRKGQLNQTEVANMMALKASTVQPDFIISVGDNFYPSESSFCMTLGSAALGMPMQQI